MSARKFLFLNVSLLTSVFCFTAVARAAEGFRSRDAGFSFLTLPTSATANGMGGASIADVENGLGSMNPGYLGIMHSTKQVKMSFPFVTAWAPDIEPDVSLKTWGLSVGHTFPRHIGLLGSATGTNVFTGYYHTKVEYDVFRFAPDPFNVTLTGKDGPFEVSEEVDALTFGIGLQRRLRLGIGGAIKKLQESSTDALLQPDFGSGFSDNSNYAFDIGGVLQAPLVSSHDAPHSSASNESIDNGLSYLVASVAYAYSNLGSKANLLSGTQFEVNLPTVERLSAAVDGIYRFHPQVVISGKVALERENDKVGNLEPIYRRGIEAGLNNAFFVRVGKFNRGFDNSDISTWGAGFKLRGLIDWILGSHPAKSNNSGKSRPLARRIDLTIDYARYSGDILTGTEFLQTTFSF